MTASHTLGDVEPYDDISQAATIMHGIKSSLDALNRLPRSAIDMNDLAEIEERVSRLWRPRDRRAA